MKPGDFQNYSGLHMNLGFFFIFGFVGQEGDNTHWAQGSWPVSLYAKSSETSSESIIQVWVPGVSRASAKHRDISIRNQKDYLDDKNTQCNLFCHLKKVFQ